MTLQTALFDANPTHTNDGPTPWLVSHLQRTGVLTETGLTRRARPRPCPKHCGTWTVAGLDADTCAFETHADTQPLTPLGEALALATGRRTVELIHTRGRFQLEQRWADHIEGRPAGQGRWDVLAAHDCTRIPDAWTCPSAFAPPPKPTRDEEPPF